MVLVEYNVNILWTIIDSYHYEHLTLYISGFSSIVVRKKKKNSLRKKKKGKKKERKNIDAGRFIINISFIKQHDRNFANRYRLDYNIPTISTAKSKYKGSKILKNFKAIILFHRDYLFLIDKYISTDRDVRSNSKTKIWLNDWK